MIRKVVIAAASGAVLALSTAAFAQQPERRPMTYKARAMLMNVVADVNVDREQAFEMFNQGAGRFMNGNIYVFCFDSENGNSSPWATQMRKNCWART